MSYTEIYTFNKNGEGENSADIHNSWLGAMYIWHSLEEKYLPPLSYSFDKEKYAHRFLPEQMQEIWNLVKAEKMLEHENIMMLTTFDYAFVKRTDLSKVIDAYEKFIEEFPSKNLKEQIDIMREIIEDEEIFCIGWCQTSVSSFLSGYHLNDKKHWFLFEEK